MGKTGSSSLQSWLSLNSAALARQGIGYADLVPQAKHGRISSGNGQPLWQAFRKEDLDEVVRLLRHEYLPPRGSDVGRRELRTAAEPAARRRSASSGICVPNWTSR
ncbi:MAG: hypothetical protein U5K56_20290 [Halioglobus sp.]|nr:hypothetical protein [Halioglobus sp.]